MGKWILSNFEISRGGIGFLPGTAFLLRAALEDSAMDTTKEIGGFGKWWKGNKIEPMKMVMEDRESDYDARFGQQVIKIRPKLKRIFPLSLGF